MPVDQNASTEEKFLRYTEAQELVHLAWSIPIASKLGFKAGQILGSRYEILEFLGGGAMGEVFKARDYFLGKIVALKFRIPRGVDSPDERIGNRIRFFGEARKGLEVTHIHICRIYNAEEVDGYDVISMEYIDGEDLMSLLHRAGRLSTWRVIVLGIEICSGLSAIHSIGIFHQDLKPSNIMIDRDGQAKISDFGLADQMLQGCTRMYAAPEQLESREVSVQSDLYSFGLVLAEMLTGKPPQCEDSDPQKRLGFEPSENRALNDLIRRCLEKEPRDRPASASEVREVLDGLLRMEAA